MKKHAESHMDHGFTQEQWDYIFAKYADQTAFFIDTLELPEALGTVVDELYGPSAGDPPVAEVDVFYGKRGERAWSSRLTMLPKRKTRFVRVIAGPHEGEPCILYTAYAVSSIDMPQAPKEPGDLEAQIVAAKAAYDVTTDGLEKLARLEAQLSESKIFWSTHALSAPQGLRP
jgi:hypothetical protein